MATRSSRNQSDLMVLLAVILGLLIVGGGKLPEILGGDQATQGPAPQATSIPQIGVPADLSMVKVVPDGTAKGGYDRTKNFGTAWADVDRNGCDTRNDMLKRDMSDVVFKAGSRCVVVSGTLQDPYTGKEIVWTKAKASSVQVDHIIPLKRAWDLGAWQWTPEKRLAYANDPDVLLSVDGPANGSKSDRGPETWMPKNQAVHCDYAKRYISVSAKYELPVTVTDKVVLERALETCAK